MVLTCSKVVLINMKYFYRQIVTPDISLGAHDYYTVSFFMDTISFIIIAVGAQSFGVGLLMPYSGKFLEGKFFGNFVFLKKITKILCSIWMLKLRCFLPKIYFRNVCDFQKFNILKISHYMASIVKLDIFEGQQF